MATFNKPIATNQGIALLKAQVAGSDSITFTKTVFSSDDYSQSADSDIANLTAIQSMDLTVPAQTFQDVNGNTKVRAIGYNNSVNQAFYIKTYALYAKNKAGNEILFAVASSQTADFVPAFNNAQLTQISYTFTFAIDQTQNITLSDQHEITVTQADLAGINNAVNSNASSLTAQQSSYASSLNSAFSSNTSSMNSAFSANSSNASSYVSSASSSLQSQVSSYAGSIASNSSAISSNASLISALQSDALQTFGVVPTSDLASISKDGIYSLGGNSYVDAPYSPIYGTITQVGTSYAVKTQIIISNLGEYYYRVVNSWGIEGWFRLSSKDDINSLNSSLSSLQTSLATQTNNISSSVAANSSAIASNANNLSSAINSVSVSNNAVSSSIASTVSTNQSSIATNSSAISSLQTSVANNSLSIANNTSQIAKNDTINTQQINQIVANIQNVQNQVTSNNVVAMNYKGDVPSTTLSNVWQTGYYNLGGQIFTDGPYGSNVAMYGQMVIMTTGGVTTQQIIDNGGGLYTRALNSWGITPWVKH